MYILIRIYLGISIHNSIFSKLKTCCSLIHSVYYSLLYSHLIYDCPVWTTSNKTIDTIQILQKKCLRISHTNPLSFRTDCSSLMISLCQLQLIFEFNNMIYVTYLTLQLMYTIITLV